VPAQWRSVQWLDRMAVAPVPAEIDISNADKVRDQLLAVLHEGATVLVVDMSETTFCDSAGVNALVRVYQQALALGAAVRLVTTTRAVQRVLDVTGVDRLIDTFRAVDAALAAGGAARAPEVAVLAPATGKGVTDPAATSPAASDPAAGDPATADPAAADPAALGIPEP
jgi:anti-sigma B factor antagonist